MGQEKGQPPSYHESVVTSPNTIIVYERSDNVSYTDSPQQVSLRLASRYSPFVEFNLSNIRYTV